MSRISKTSHSLDSVSRFQAILEQRLILGEFPTGQPLPKIRSMAAHYKLAPRTVMAAVARLVEAGKIQKVGKAFFPWQKGLHVRKTALQTVWITRWDSGPHASLFTHGFLAPALVAMEKELRLHHTVLRFVSKSTMRHHLNHFLAVSTQFKGHLGDAIRDTPKGLCLWEAGGSPLTVLTELFAGMVKRSLQLPANRRGLFLPKIVLTGSNYRNPPPFVHLINDGNIITEVMRVAAQYVANKKYRSFTLFFNEDKNEWPYFIAFAKIRAEIKALNENFPMKFFILSRYGGSSAQFLERVMAKPGFGGRDRLTAILSKYQAQIPENLLGECEVYTDLWRAMKQAKKGLWGFSEGADGIEAIKFLVKHGVSVPNEIGVLGFEDKPELRAEGLSVCIPDWNHIGFLMAHSLLDDFRQPKTRKGFLQVRAEVAHRGSTL